MKEKALALWKLLLSFRTTDWTFDDYPVVIRKQGSFSRLGETDQTFTYWAVVVNWGTLTAEGTSPLEARKNLAKAFENVKATRISEGKPLPRPGTIAPIEFASRAKIETHQDLLDHFMEKVLHVEWAFISDESSLFDFTADESIAPFFVQIKAVYGVDVSDLESGNIAAILERIAVAKL